ncbi:MAG: cysteine hydrolase [Burkholderiales bacterium]|nr:cysteine hydrolase [Burkholderiales bacterium]
MNANTPHPNKRALLVIDVQNEYFTGNLRVSYPPVEQTLPNICRAMDAAHAAHIPIVLVQHVASSGAPIFAPGSEGVALHPDIAGRPHDLLVQKSMASALTGTTLAAWLKAHEIEVLTIVGYMTHNCNDATARQASHEGWRVELLHDASASLPYSNAVGSASAEEIHRVFSVVMHTGFAAVASTDEWLAALAKGEVLAPDNVYSSNQRALASC